MRDIKYLLSPTCFNVWEVKSHSLMSCCHIKYIRLWLFILVMETYSFYQKCMCDLEGHAYIPTRFDLDMTWHGTWHLRGFYNNNNPEAIRWMEKYRGQFWQPISGCNLCERFKPLQKRHDSLIFKWDYSCCFCRDLKVSIHLWQCISYRLD